MDTVQRLAQLEKVLSGSGATVNHAFGICAHGSQFADHHVAQLADVEPKSITPKTKKVFQEFLMNSGWAERESPDGTTVLKSDDGCSATFADTVVTLRVPRTQHDEEASSDASQRTSMIACELAAELGLGVYFPFDGSWATMPTN